MTIGSALPPAEGIAYRGRAGGRGAGRVTMHEKETGGSQSANSLLSELAALLAGSPSGVTFVYACLDTLVERWELKDALLVVEGLSTGRQVFRAGRRPLDGSWPSELGASGERGLHTDPAVDDSKVADGVVGLCEIALRLDVLDHDAAHDPLTGLLNRRSFERVLAQALSRSRRYGWSFSLVMLDLNRFKSLNDRHGHAAGDRVLRQVGSVLRSSLRAGDVAARIGGDEFAVVLSRGDAASGRLLAARLTALINEELTWANIGFAVGVASAPSEALEAEDLFQLADSRLYEAKAG